MAAPPPINSMRIIPTTLPLSSLSFDPPSLFLLCVPAQRPSVFDIRAEVWPIAKRKKSIPHKIRAIELEYQISRESLPGRYKSG